MDTNMMNNGAALPNGGMLMVTAPAVAPTVAGQGGTTDPRIWRPKVTKDNPNYKALIRALPRGRDLQAYPYVALMIHRFRDVNTGKRMTAKCCKNIPGVRTCPYCEDVWGRYRAAKEVPGVKKDDLKAFLNQLPEEEWYGNFLIRMDQNHSELANQVKVWPHSKYQHTAFQDPVDNFMKKQADAANPAKANEIQVDTGDAFIPYDPMNGYDYVLEGKWDPEKTFGNGKQGAPTYKGSKFAKNPSPLFTKTVVDQQTGQPMAVVDENSIYAILDQCHDLNFVFEDVPTEQQAVMDLQKFWSEANELAMQRSRASGGNYYTNRQQPAPQAQVGMPNYGAQPFATGMAGMAQNNIPQVPANAKITTSNNAAAFMGQAPAQQAPVQQAPAQQTTILPTNVPMPNPIPAAAAPVTPAFAQTPPQMTAPVQPANVNPQFAQPQFAQPQVAVAQPQFAQPQMAVAQPAPAAQPQPTAAQTYTPPAAPPLAQAQPAVGLQVTPPAQQSVLVETDGDDDLPF